MPGSWLGIVTSPPREVEREDQLLRKGLGSRPAPRRLSTVETSTKEVRDR